MKSIWTIRVRYWSFVIIVTAILGIGVARYEGIAVSLVAIAVALVLGYIVDANVR
jgi:hypothetical protein